MTRLIWLLYSEMKFLVIPAFFEEDFYFLSEMKDQKIERHNLCKMCLKEKLYTSLILNFSIVSKNRPGSSLERL